MGSDSPLPCPEVRRRTLDLRPWIPWPLPAARGSRGREALGSWEGRKEGKEKPSAAYMGVSDRQRSPHSKRCVVGIFSRYLEAAAEQSL